jgi:hypothetical protein
LPTRLGSQHEAPFYSGVFVGVGVSPATFVFGSDSEFEVGIHALLFEYPEFMQHLYIGGYVGLQWFFASE